jgi:hypothetical protein
LSVCLLLSSVIKELNLRPKDLKYALRAWVSYLHNKPLLDEVMLHYGTNADGQMERGSARHMLTDLNGGKPPKESALDWVMAEAAAMPLSPGISALELIKVMSLWYTKDLSREMPCCPSRGLGAAAPTHARPGARRRNRPRMRQAAGRGAWTSRVRASPPRPPSCRAPSRRVRRAAPRSAACRDRRDAAGRAASASAGLPARCKP